MRGELAGVGIVLEPAAEPSSALVAPPSEPAPVDRAEIRAILVAAGAPPGDLEWLVRSCPTVEHARGYRPPPRQAWCLDCEDVQPCDGEGCLACRGAR
jgi:hypothetical protein